MGDSWRGLMADEREAGGQGRQGFRPQPQGAPPGLAAPDPGVQPGATLPEQTVAPSAGWRWDGRAGTAQVPGWDALLGGILQPFFRDN